MKDTRRYNIWLDLRPSKRSKLHKANLPWKVAKDEAEWLQSLGKTIEIQLVQ